MKLEIKNITKVYDKKILDDLSCTLTRGIYGVLGPNGAGKSTLIRVICGIESPSEGRVLYNGNAISDLGGEYRDILGYAPQEMGYYPDFTAVDFLSYISILKGIPQKHIKDEVNRVLRIVELTHIGGKKIKDFSGGMKQRLNIAQAILNDPPILILDEPTAGLDIEERIRFKQFISEKSNDRIVIFATHIVSDIEDIANEILILKNGKIEELASIEKILKRIEGKVWLCECDKNEFGRLKENYKIVNTKMKENCIELRLIADKKPITNAIQTKESLQDLSLYLFGEKLK